MSQSLATEILEVEEDTQKGKYLTFSLGTEFYGILDCYKLLNENNEILLDNIQ